MICNPFSRSEPGCQRLLLFGAGGHARELAWLAEQAWGESLDIVFVVDQRSFLRPELNGRRVVLLDELKPAHDDAWIVAIGDPADRRRIAERLSARGNRATRLIHPRVECSRWVGLGEGSVLCAGVSITTNVTIGRHVHVNRDCTIGHDVMIEDFVTLSPGVQVSGHVQIDAGAFVGTGATIINGSAGRPIRIGADSVVAAGACVIEDVEASSMVAGVPAQRKR